MQNRHKSWFWHAKIHLSNIKIFSSYSTLLDKEEQEHTII